MLKYGNKTYPSNLDAIIRDKALLHVVYKYLKANLSEGGLLFYMSPFQPKTLYENFIASGSKMEINVSYNDVELAHELAEKAATDPLMWKHPDWVDAIQTCRDEVYSLLMRGPILQFWSSEEFAQYHLKNGGQREDLDDWNPVDDPSPPPRWQLAAEHFKFKNADAMKAYIAAFERHGEDKTLGAAAKLLRTEGKTLNAHIFNKLLVAQGFAKKPTPTPAPAELEDEADGMPEAVDVPVEKIKVEEKNLRKCGFEEVKKKKNVDLIKGMVRAHLAHDRQEAIKAYKKLLTLEPQNKPLQQTPYVEMMKQMRKHKAFKVAEAS